MEATEPSEVALQYYEELLKEDPANAVSDIPSSSYPPVG